MNTTNCGLNTDTLYSYKARRSISSPHKARQTSIGKGSQTFMRGIVYQPGEYLQLPQQRLQLPIFLPDATLGVVRSLDATDVRQCGIQAVVMNTFHLMQHPGSSTIQALGGLHKMSAWPQPIMTDSGGFQAYSLIQQNAKFGSIHPDRKSVV